MITHPESSRQKRQRLIKEAIAARQATKVEQAEEKSPKKKKRFGK